MSRVQATPSAQHRTQGRPVLMSREGCAQLVCAAFGIGLVTALVQMPSVFHLYFSDPMVAHFFGAILPAMKCSCMDTTIHEANDLLLPTRVKVCVGLVYVSCTNTLVASATFRIPPLWALSPVPLTSWGRGLVWCALCLPQAQADEFNRKYTLSLRPTPSSLCNEPQTVNKVMEVKGTTDRAVDRSISYQIDSFQQETFSPGQLIFLLTNNSHLTSR